jgi:hypothetical protein
VIAVAVIGLSRSDCLSTGALALARSTDEELMTHGLACRNSVYLVSRPRLLLALTAFGVLSVLAIAAPARADSVTDWDQIAAAALQSPGTATPPGAGQGAPSIAHLAMVHAAVYDAVNAIDGGHEPYVSSPAAEPW